ncbi:hypothetical protein NC652_033387 [Populus alba x Populus x berolinensis]|nr:hypothetical protein NC652_033387 [Populus alba x Populus x berolinensis]
MARLDGEDIGYGFHQDLKLISEVQAPSRSVTRFFYAAFSAGAGISLLFTIPRIFRAIKGGGDAPDLWETARNAAINTGATPLPLLGSDIKVPRVFLSFAPKDMWGQYCSFFPLVCCQRQILVFIRLVRLFNLFRLIRGRQESEGVAPGEDGMPDRPQIVNELPPIEAFLSKLER